MSRSSTFNSDAAIDARGDTRGDAAGALAAQGGLAWLYRRWGAVAVCLMVLIACEGITRQTWFWTLDARGDPGQFVSLEQTLREHDPPPRIVVMGNSRTRDAIIPGVVEDGLGLGRGEMANLSMTLGEPFDYYMMYRRNREVLAEGEVLIVGLEDWFFAAEPWDSERFRWLASWSDRWHAFTRTHDPTLVMGWLWRTLDAHRAAGRLPRALVSERRRELPMADDGRLMWRDDEPEVGPEEADIDTELQMYYEGWAPGRESLQYLEGVIRMARRDGLRVLLVRPPLRDVFIEARQEIAPEAQPHYESVLAELRQRHPDLAVFSQERASEEGLPQHYFLDYGHMGRRGGEIYSERLVQAVAPLIDEPDRESQRHATAGPTRRDGAHGRTTHGKHSDDE